MAAAWPQTNRSCDNSAPLLELTLLEDSYRLIVPTSTFLTEAVRAQGSPPRSAQVMVVPWENWGPRSTRFVTRDDEDSDDEDSDASNSEDLRDRCIPGCSGKRIVYKDRILDFNPYDAAHNICAHPRVRRTRTTTREGSARSEASATLRTEPTREDFGDEYWDGMSAGMPYRRTKLRLPKEIDVGEQPLGLIEGADGPKVGPSFIFMPARADQYDAAG